MATDPRGMTPEEASKATAEMVKAHQVRAPLIDQIAHHATDLACALEQLGPMGVPGLTDAERDQLTALAGKVRRG